MPKINYWIADRIVYAYSLAGAWSIYPDSKLNINRELIAIYFPNGFVLIIFFVFFNQSLKVLNERKYNGSNGVFQVQKLFFSLALGVFLVTLFSVLTNVRHTNYKILHPKFPFQVEKNKYIISNQKDTVVIDTLSTLIGKTKNYLFIHQYKDSVSYILVVPLSVDMKSFSYPQENSMKYY